MFAIEHSYLIPLLPLAGAAIAGFFGARWLKGQSHWPIWLGVGASAVLSIMLLVGMLSKQEKGTLVPENPSSFYTHLVAPETAGKPSHQEGHFQLSASVDWYSWIEAGNFKATAGFFFDPLTAVMLCVVTGIGFFIVVFAKGYMAGEGGYFRFFAYLGLFIFAMTILVMGNNLIMLYLGWEGVGLCSYLLIGYYYDKPAAREAAKKAFLVNRIGDLGFGLGIMLIYVAFGTVSFYGSADEPGVLTQATRALGGAPLTALQEWAMLFIPFLLMVGAFGKSAQFPLYVWLPDAMEGPTPVSALIHAATMVTAGVYMIVRCSVLFYLNLPALYTIAAVGTFTAIFAATIALRQFDLKKVFAYSTVSQLGFMFVGAAVLAPVAGIFHLVTHAFFKALLFLSSGVVMHAMMGELDMRKMSGLKRVLPKTRIFMLIGCLALAGFPVLSGFWSKDEVIISAFEFNTFIGLVLLFTAFLTAYYTFRLYFRVFEGPELIPAAPAGGHGHGHGDVDEHAHASASAVQTGDVAESGVDRHLKGDTHAHPNPEDHGHGHHNHEPLSMMLPLLVLSIGALLAGVVLVYNHNLADFLGKSPSFSAGYLAADHMVSQKNLDVHLDPHMFGRKPDEDYVGKPHLPMMIISGLVAILGIAFAYVMHLQDRPRAERLAARFGGLTRMLEAKYWVDEIYQGAIVEPLRSVGRVLFAFDRLVIDGLVWIVGFVPTLFGFALKLTTQRGSLQGYAVMMVLGIAAILLVMFYRY